MRILLDQPFPVTAGQLQPREVSLERWQGVDISDAELISEAVEDNYNAVAFLGRAVLARPELLRQLDQSRLPAIIVAEADPIQGMLAMLAHLRAIESKLSPSGACIVHSTRVYVVEYTSLLAATEAPSDLVPSS